MLHILAMKRFVCRTKINKFCILATVLVLVPVSVLVVLGQQSTTPGQANGSLISQLVSNPSDRSNLPKFAYVINNDVCDSGEVFTVVLVHSHPAFRDRRDCMRRSVPSSDLRDIGLRRVFLLARAEWNDQLHYPKTPQSAIDEENALHRDIIQGDFKEHYHNLTHKHIMGLRWAVEFCSVAQFVLKMDDDIIVDLYQFRDRLKYRYVTRTNLILGLLQIDSKPIRDPNSKWFVSDADYAPDTYPNYVSGWAYAASMDAIVKIVKQATRLPFQWIDDLYVTGIVAQKANVSREGLNSLYTIHAAHLRCCVELPHYKEYFCDFYVGPSEGDVSLMAKVLDHARSCFELTCVRRNRSSGVEKTCFSLNDGSNQPLGVGVGEVIKISR